MSGQLAIQKLKPWELDAELRALWASFRAGDPAFASPYFDLRYVLAAAESAPGAQIAVISRGGQVEGFLPFQRRGRLIQPVAAPLTDYHGLLPRPGAAIDLREVLVQLGVRRFRFSGLAGAADGARGATRTAMAADLSQGLEAYLARRDASFLKDKRRRARRLAEAHGPVSFSLAAPSDEVLDFVMRLKRAQLRRTGQHDIFASPWVGALLRRLAEPGEADFGLRAAELRVGGQVAAAELGLLSGDVYHLWFPVYEPRFARYSPGSLMTLETLRAAAGQGISLVDFGPAGERYKRDFADPHAQVLEGDVTVGGVVEKMRRTADLALAGTPTLRRTLGAAGERVDRRWDRIAACEPRLDGQVGAASRSLTLMAARRPKTSIGVGLGLGVGIYSLIAAD